jgi:hypothetical protein
MRSSLRAVALAALSCTVASAAWANAQSTASISNLTFTLYDLNPSDDIAPSFNFVVGAGQYGSTSTSASVTDNFARESGAESLTRAQPFLAHTSGVALSTGQAYATVLPYEVSAFGQAGGSAASYSASAGSNTGSNQNTYIAGIELSANTLLVIHADAAVSGTVSASACNTSSYYYYYCNASDSSSASVSMNLSFSNTGASSSGNGSFSGGLAGSASNYASTNYTYNPLTGTYMYVTTPATTSFDKTDSVSLVFANNTGLIQHGLFSMSASVQGQSNSGTADALVDVPIRVLPDGATVTSTLQQIGEVAAGGTVYGVVASVPEPGTWATMGLGLLGLAAVSRRRQRQA